MKQQSPLPLPETERIAQREIDRRRFLRLTGGTLAAAFASKALGSIPDTSAERVELAPLANPASEVLEKTPSPSLPPEDKVGFAIVGLGHLSLDRILPAFGSSKFAKPVALVSGHRDKALKVARAHGVPEHAIYDYKNYDELAGNPEVKAVYIVLPNGMHAEYTIRGAQAGKHVLCEKPMATGVRDCQSMVDACSRANTLLMVAYRNQYEPLNRLLVKAVRRGELGSLREFVSANSQNQGDPTQWRLNRALAGGGPLPDVGIYCINAARFLSGEEPTEVFGQTYRVEGDPRFREVESTVQFTMKFPGGLRAACTASYDSHRSQFLRLQGTQAWAEFSPAFAYDGLQLRFGRRVDEKDTVSQVGADPKDQFAEEIDHFSSCILSGKRPHTPGEEGLQDIRIMEAIYESAQKGAAVQLQSVANPRGPDPVEES
jgi:predicted dehydrogenase